MAPFDNLEVGRRLGQTREAKGLTQAALCRILGWSQQRWYSYETGRVRMPPDQAALFATRMGVSLDWIYLGSEKDLPDDLRAYLNQQS